MALSNERTALDCAAMQTEEHPTRHARESPAHTRCSCRRAPGRSDAASCWFSVDLVASRTTLTSSGNFGGSLQVDVSGQIGETCG